MLRPVTFYTITLLILTIGCDDSRQFAIQKGQSLQKRRDAVLTSCRQSVAFAREFDSLFSGGHTSAGEGRFGWEYHFEVGLHGRYVVEGRVPLAVDASTLTVVGSRPPVIYVREVARVIPSSESVGGYATFTTNQAQLGMDEWRKLVDSHGNFLVVGYTMVTNAPIPHFDRVCRFPGSVNK